MIQSRNQPQFGQYTVHQWIIGNMSFETMSSSYHCETSAQLVGHFREPEPRNAQAGCPMFQMVPWGVRPSELLAKASQQSQKPRKPSCHISINEPTEPEPETHSFWHFISEPQLRWNATSCVSHVLVLRCPKSLRLIHRSIPNRWHRACLIDWHVTSCINESRNPWNQWVSWVSGSLIEMRLGSWIIHNIIILVRLMNEKGPWNSAVLWQERTWVRLHLPL